MSKGSAVEEPLPPRLKWRAITLATLILVPGFWSLLTGLVAAASDDQSDAPNAGAALALGLAAMPFVFIILAFLSQQQRAPRAVLKAMGISLVVSLVVSVIALDAVTALVAGTGAGGVVALRAEPIHSYRVRAAAVFFATLYTFILVRAIGPAALLIAPVFPLTAIGIADHILERRRDR